MTDVFRIGNDCPKCGSVGEECSDGRVYWCTRGECDYRSDCGPCGARKMRMVVDEESHREMTFWRLEEVTRES